MNKNYLLTIFAIALLAALGYIFYPKFYPTAASVQPKQERKILYWTDPMLPGDRSDRPGKSPMGMDRVPVYADSVQSESSATAELAPGEYYTCAMHTQIRRGKPGFCPICGMALIKKSSSRSLSEDEKNSIAEVSISPSKQILANVATSTAKVMSLEKEIRTVGTINYAEPNFKHISTRFPGRLDKLYLTYTGQSVRKGDPVAEVYSPEAISAQQEYLLAKESYDEVKDQADLISGGAHSLLDQAREKLVRWGFTDNQIAELESTNVVRNTITIYSPVGGTVLKKNVDPQQYAATGDNMYDVADLSTVWMEADVYEYELHNLKIGQSVAITADAFPGRTFSGRIIFVSPTIEPSSRTARIRMELSNPRMDLKIGMFANAAITIKFAPSIVVPASSVLSTGNRTIVWVKGNRDVYKPRLVTVGERSADMVQILTGIEEGDTIVTSGGYLIDSESQLEASTKQEARP